ncbi:hypothetical protein KC963_00890 [Candidatus Saccharibacteria bacterium]|nr:hypothetical protein [Candidatus Saccharibacteria bacterium]
MGESSRSQFNFEDLEEFDKSCRQTIGSPDHARIDAQLCLEAIEREFSEIDPPITVYDGEIE